MRVKNIMTTNVKTAYPETKVRDVALLMCLHRISGLPVIDSHENIIGVISEKDILLAIYPKVDDFMQASAKPSFEEMEYEYPDILNLQVQQLMTRRVFTVGPEEPIMRAASAMFVHRIRRIPVALNHRLAGIVSVGDVHKAVFKEMFEREFAELARTAEIGAGQISP